MVKQGMVSIWLGNIKNEISIEEYVYLKYDENGESVPSKFFINFKIDMDETDVDFIEKAVLKENSNNISVMLEGCSYEEIMIPKFNKQFNLTKSYNAVILIYNFEYDNNINSIGEFDFITSISYV
ncbi:immunity 22 family protein [Peribacillus frigoritolerans]|uniref:immunity 22 family protein n=1 Tax=Peribacillus frigoritolerans TaxID=450367 RepID=UPI0020C09972|nr:immunity 22 family protein [Peribacillus frigoritolerans]